jgi:ATP-binding cassette subfamily B protein
MLAIAEDVSFAGEAAASPRLEPGAPLVEARDLTLDYSVGADGTRVPALAGVSFSVRAGEIIGMAGPSGSGKSSVIRLLLRLAHQSGGALSIGAQPIHQFSRQSIGELFGYVGQNPFVFRGSVADNIAYGLAATRADIERAARQACIHDEILALPGGYDFVISERGLNLSGGQRQRIAMARVFLKDPPVWILDEATSQIDNLSELRILDAVRQHGRQRTIIMVAHRLSTLRSSDRILVFDAGRLVEQGSYEELRAAGGLFERLVQAGDTVATNGRGDAYRAVA